MEIRPRTYRQLLAASLLVLAAGCESPWYAAEPLADKMIPPVNAFPLGSSRDALAERVGQPSDVRFFGDQAEYMGDADGYRYVHVRDMSDYFGFLGECVYTIPDSQWPMAHPMDLSYDASRWQDVTWMGNDAPAGIAQNAGLKQTPSFPLGAPKTQPAVIPPTANFTSQPAATTTAPANTPATESTTGTAPSTETAQPKTAPTESTTTQQTVPVTTSAPASQQ